QRTPIGARLERRQRGSRQARWLAGVCGVHALASFLLVRLLPPPPRSSRCPSGWPSVPARPQRVRQIEVVPRRRAGALSSSPGRESALLLVACAVATGKERQMSLPKHYDPQRIELVMAALWEREHVYAFDPSSAVPVFAIDTPPPTVSGNLHLGHVYSY